MARENTRSRYIYSAHAKHQHAHLWRWTGAWEQMGHSKQSLTQQGEVTGAADHSSRRRPTWSWCAFKPAAAHPRYWASQQNCSTRSRHQWTPIGRRRHCGDHHSLLQVVVSFACAENAWYANTCSTKCTPGQVFCRRYCTAAQPGPASAAQQTEGGLTPSDRVSVTATVLAMLLKFQNSLLSLIRRCWSEYWLTHVIRCIICCRRAPAITLVIERVHTIANFPSWKPDFTNQILLLVVYIRTFTNYAWIFGLERYLATH
jgi:hypothetical protein